MNRQFASMLLIALAAGAAWVTSARAADPPAGGIKIDAATRSILIPARIAPRKLAHLPDVYPIEVIASYSHEKKGQKAHETVVTFDALPSEIHKALESFGLKPGKPARGEEGVPAGPEVKVYLEIPGTAGAPLRVPIEKTLVDRTTGKSLATLKWLFTGSVFSQPDPDKPEKVYGADRTGTLIAVFPVTDETVLQTSLTMKDEPLVKLETNKALLPAEGTACTLVIQAK